MSTLEALRAIKDKQVELYREEKLLKEKLKQEINNEQLKWLETAFELVVETPRYTGSLIHLYCSELPYPPGEVFWSGKTFSFYLTIPEICQFKIIGTADNKRYVNRPLELIPLINMTSFIFGNNHKADPRKIALWMHKNKIKNSSTVEYAVFRGQLGSILDELGSNQRKSSE